MKPAARIGTGASITTTPVALALIFFTVRAEGALQHDRLAFLWTLTMVSPSQPSRSVSSVGPMLLVMVTPLQ